MALNTPLTTVTTVPVIAATTPTTTTTTTIPVPAISRNLAFPIDLDLFRTPEPSVSVFKVWETLFPFFATLGNRLENDVGPYVPMEIRYSAINQTRACNLLVQNYDTTIRAILTQLSCLLIPNTTLIYSGVDVILHEIIGLGMMVPCIRITLYWKDGICTTATSGATLPPLTYPRLLTLRPQIRRHHRIGSDINAAGGAGGGGGDSCYLALTANLDREFQDSFLNPTSLLAAASIIPPSHPSLQTMKFNP